MRIKMLIILITLINIDLSGQDVSFYRENITMKINNEQFFVSGRYFFRSKTADKKLLFYPFPKDSLYGKVNSILLYDLTNNQTVELVTSDTSKILFLADFSKNLEIELLISYEQNLLGNRAEYILVTTKIWKKPLEEAYYQLIVPANHVITCFSIPPIDSIITQQEKIYTWEKFEYMPLENLIFEFEVR